MKRKMETGEDASLEPLKALFGEVTDPDIVAKKKRIYKKCKHEKLKKDCRECSPSKFCPHNRRRSACKICSPGNFCQHNRQPNRCKECNTSGLCLHGVWPSECKECNKKWSCIHGRWPYQCRDCMPEKIICKHGGRKNSCRICTPGILCKHGKIQQNCQECGGSSYCECKIKKMYCPKHGGSKLCIRCKLVCVGPKYDKHCVDCFVNYYPGDPRSYRNSKLKRRETIVREAIDGVFEGFIHDKAFSTGGCCPHRREIDHRILINGTVLAVETDEKAHVGYNKQNEINRYDDLFMASSTKFIFIRFNCDTTREERGAKTSLEHKIQALLSCIGTQITRIRNNENTELCDIVKLFYCANCSNNGSDICLCSVPQ